MELKKDVLEEFKGGQAEIQNSNEGYLYRGQIGSITLEGREVVIGFTWLAKGEGFPPLPERWVKDDQLDYRASLLIYGVSNIGPSGDEVGGGDRLCLTSPIVGETVILYPADGSKLDPSKVEGLELVSA